MAKRKITAREILTDVRAGVTDPELMKKYKLSSQGLQSLFNKMLEAGVISRYELDERAPLAERTVELGLFVCPACAHIEHVEFTECPKCGFVRPPEAKSVARTEARAKKPPKKVKVERDPTTILEEIDSSIASRAKKIRKTPAPYDFEGELKPGIDSVVNYSRILLVAAAAAYAVGFTGLILIMILFPSDGLLTVTQAIIGVIIVQIPPLVIVFAAFITMRALGESMKVFSEVSTVLLSEHAKKSGVK